MKLSILTLRPCRVSKNWHHIYYFPYLRYHRGCKHRLDTARSSSSILFLSSFKTLGQMPLLPANRYCSLCQCVEQLFPQQLQFQTRSLPNPTLRKNGFCHDDLVTQHLTQKQRFLRWPYLPQAFLSPARFLMCFKKVSFDSFC